MDIDDAVDLVEDLEEEDQNTLENLEEEERNLIEEGSNYPEDSAEDWCKKICINKSNVECWSSYRLS